jgi:type II secretory pathway component PulF
MSERIEALKRSIQRDKQRVLSIQERIKANQEKLRDLENAEILNNLNSLSAQGYPVGKIIEAIGNRDADALMRLMAGNKLPEEESGTGSASQIVKEDKESE